MSLIPGGQSFGDRAVKDGGEEGSLETKGAFSSTWRVSSDSTRSEIETKSSSSDNEIFSTSPEIDAGMDRTGMTVATIKDSRNCEGSVATSLQFFLPVRPMDDEDDDRATERPSGRSDHDRVT